MSLIDFILNLAGVILWLSWRSSRLDPLAGSVPATLIGTIKRTRPTRLNRWRFMIFVGILVFVRAFFYKEIGPAVNWTPKLDLGAVALAFRVNDFSQQLLFSVLSLLRALTVLYFWLLAMAVINRREAPPKSVHKLILLQLGRAGQWPLWLQLTAPMIAGVLLWTLFYPLLAKTGIINWTGSAWSILLQGILIGAGLYLSLDYILPAILFLHLVASYVYLGSNPFWDFISIAAENILAPLRRLPLRLGKFNFAPLVGILLIGFLLNMLPLMRWVLDLEIFSGTAAGNFFERLVLWPH
jgi:uncharacterized protein YggT (Ycf19 family)